MDADTYSEVNSPPSVLTALNLLPVRKICVTEAIDNAQQAVHVPSVTPVKIISLRSRYGNGISSDSHSADNDTSSTNLGLFTFCELKEIYKFIPIFNTPPSKREESTQETSEHVISDETNNEKMLETAYPKRNRNQNRPESWKEAIKKIPLLTTSVQPSRHKDNILQNHREDKVQRPEEKVHPQREEKHKIPVSHPEHDTVIEIEVSAINFEAPPHKKPRRQCKSKYSLCEFKPTNALSIPLPVNKYGPIMSAVTSRRGTETFQEDSSTEVNPVLPVNKSVKELVYEILETNQMHNGNNDNIISQKNGTNKRSIVGRSQMLESHTKKAMPSGGKPTRASFNIPDLNSLMYSETMSKYQKKTEISKTEKTEKSQRVGDQLVQENIRERYGETTQRSIKRKKIEETIEHATTRESNKTSEDLELEAKMSAFRKELGLPPVLYSETTAEKKTRKMKDSSDPSMPDFMKATFRSKRQDRSKNVLLAAIKSAKRQQTKSMLYSTWNFGNI